MHPTYFVLLQKHSQFCLCVEYAGIFTLTELIFCCQYNVKAVTVKLLLVPCHVDIICLLLQSFGNFSSVGHFMTPPALGSETTVYVLDTADMGHAEPDGSNEWEDDLNARLYNAPGK